MLRVVAEYADRWNSTGTLEQMAERNRILDEQCVAVGRDPGQSIRSHLYVPTLLPDEKPWDSSDAYRDFVGRFREAGIDEFIMQPPPDARYDIVERVASDVLPALRAGAAP
jgi:hypothetical protein